MKNFLKVLIGLAILVPLGTNLIIAENAARDANRNPAVLFYDETNSTTRMPRVDEDGKIMTTLTGSTQIDTVIVQLDDLHVTLTEEIATETTLALVLDELEEFTYTGEDLKVVFSNSTIGVTGTFWQETQPVSMTDRTSYDSQLEQFKFTSDDLKVTLDSETVLVNGTIEVSNFPATQPVSIASMPSTPVTGTFYQETQPVSIASMPSTPVTGTFYQETQPVSIASMPSTPVTGTFFQETQPISMSDRTVYDTQLEQLKFTGDDLKVVMSNTGITATLADNTVYDTQLEQFIFTDDDLNVVFSNASIGVTGTFWQETQPVSIASMPSTPVTGTFWQETQPISGTVTANAGTGTMAVSIASMPSTPVTGTFWQETQPISISSMPSTPVTGTFWQETQPISLSDKTVYDTQLEQLKFTGDDLKVVVSNAAFDVTLTDVSVYDTQLEQFKFTGDDLQVTLASETVLVNGTVEVSNFPATQAVSIASMPSTPVTGTFFQETQPVSIASMPTTPVTGTFYQATQPVSLADKTVYDTQLEQFKFNGERLKVDTELTLSDGAATETTLLEIKVALTDATPTETIIRITCTDPGTVYSCTLPANTIFFEFFSEDGGFQYSSIEAGFTSHYRTFEEKESYWPPQINFVSWAGKVLYFKSAEAAQLVIQVQTK